MTDKLKIFLNPECSKCRLTMQLLDEKGISADVVEYLKTPPDFEELSSLLDMLGLEPREAMRTHEAPYLEKGLDDEKLSREQLIQAMIDDPVLLQRPIVVNEGRAAICRPPENLLGIL